ncbi:hypothetical protein EJB05_28195, partial [Eragrostis curvula]
MPPVRRGRGAPRPASYRKEDGQRDLGASISFPDDALSAVFARLSHNAADVIRCAATCRCWGRVVARDAAVLSHSLPPLPHLALGFFHQDAAAPTARTRKRKCSATGQASAQPCFVPTARLLRGLRTPPLAATPAGNHVLAHARPVAARNGWLVLELRRERHADGLRLCVCNPMSGDLALLPPLSGAENPGDYACALLTGHDLDPPRPLSASSFRLLVVYNRRSCTAFRCYSRDANRWGPEASRRSSSGSGPKKIASHKLRAAGGHSVVIRGVAYWALGRTALAVRLVDGPDQEPVELAMPPRGILADLPPGWHLLGLAPDGKLMHLDMAFGGTGDHIYLSLMKRVLCPSGDDDPCGAGKWEPTGVIQLKEITCKWTRQEAVSLRWYCEKSCVLFFTLGEGTCSPGTYALNLATEEVQKVTDGLECHSWRNFVGYEMDGVAYLASIAC